MSTTTRPTAPHATPRPANPIRDAILAYADEALRVVLTPAEVDDCLSWQDWPQLAEQANGDREMRDGSAFAFLAEFPHGGVDLGVAEIVAEWFGLSIEGGGTTVEVWRFLGSQEYDEEGACWALPRSSEWQRFAAKAGGAS